MVPFCLSKTATATTGFSDSTCSREKPMSTSEETWRCTGCADVLVHVGLCGLYIFVYFHVDKTNILPCRKKITPKKLHRSPSTPGHALPRGIRPSCPIWCLALYGGRWTHRRKLFVFLMSVSFFWNDFRLIFREHSFCRMPALFRMLFASIAVSTTGVYAETLWTKYWIGGLRLPRHWKCRLI